MLPLAVILKDLGHTVSGSDRSYDQGRTPEKFQWIKDQGISLYPQDGSGITNEITSVVISKAVEDTIPDIRAAKDKNIPILKRVDVLIEYFNAAKTRIAISGTSGKTTTTGMIGYLMKEAGKTPTVMNGGIFRNYARENPYSTAFVGGGDVFVSEIDESDGAEAVCAFTPDIAIIHNITLDHQPMDELKAMFSGFLAKTKIAVLNADDSNVSEVAKGFGGDIITYSTNDNAADVMAEDIEHHADGVSCLVNGLPLRLMVPGKHNISNALAAMAAGKAAGIEYAVSAKILGGFEGIKRRMEVIGAKNGITVMDDFGHNPDKVAATITTLKEFNGRLLIFFQPHGYGFLKLVWEELAQTFADELSAQDKLYFVEPLYLGGTVDKSIGSADIVRAINERGGLAVLAKDRADVKELILREAKNGDRIIVMGARDDTLSEFAQDILNSL